MRKIVAIIGALALAVSVMAQPRSIGVKVGEDLMVTYQHTVKDGFFQIDFGGSGYKGLGANITYNWSGTTKNWTFYGGFGVGGGYDFYNSHQWRYHEDELQENGNTIRRRRTEYGYAGFLGLVGSMGLMYEFAKVPLAVGIEYQPLIGVDFGRNGKPGEKGINPLGNNIKNKYQYHLRGLYDVNITVRYIIDSKL